MSSPAREPTPAAPVAPGPVAPGPEEAASATTEGSEAPHDPTGLGLAQSVARSLGAGGRRTHRRSAGRRTGPREVGPGPQVSGPHPDERDPQRLGDALERLVDSKGWTTEVNLHSLLARWASLVGPVNAAHSLPESYSDTVLTVRTDSTAWATQLRYMAPQLVALLNGALGDGAVTRVKVLGPDAPTWKKGRLSVRDGRGPRDTYG